MSTEKTMGEEGGVFLPALAHVVLAALMFFATAPAGAEGGNLRVAASFFPVAHFAAQVGGGHADITTVLPSGAEPHGWEPTPRSIRSVWEADIFLYQGGGVDWWAEKLGTEIAARGRRVLRLSEAVEPEPTLHGEAPHTWLDPLFAAREVNLIQEAFAAADPVHAEAYAANAERYSRELLDLAQAYREGLRDCALSDIIVTHDAFGHLGARYGFRTHAIAGPSPEQEPTPKSLHRLVSLAREKGIEIIFTEPLASSKAARALARDVGGTTLVLNPLGTVTEEQLSAGVSYLSEMRRNLGKLRRALKCR